MSRTKNQDAFDPDRETRWCLRQLDEGLETYESLLALIQITPQQERYLRHTIGDSKTDVALMRRREILQHFEFHVQHPELRVPSPTQPESVS